MSSIGHGHLKCRACGKPRPYWADYCKLHRLQFGQATAQELKEASKLIVRARSVSTQTQAATTVDALTTAGLCAKFIEES